MGLTLQQLELLDLCHRHGGIQSPLWALGSQQLSGSREALAAWAQERGYAQMAADPGVAGLLRDRYDVDEYVDFDLNAEAGAALDLGAPLEEEWHGGAATVLDAGTLEHVFDIAQALENVHVMLRPGGTFLALVPLTWWEHGFVNFNPKLFARLGAANGYECLAEAFWLRVRLPLVGKRFVTVVTRDGEPRPRARRWLDRLMNRLQPAGVLYCCCYRKPLEQSPFRPPADVFANW